VLKSFNAGLDVSLYPADGQRFREVLNSLVTRGMVSAAAIRNSTRAVLAMKKAVGLFEKPFGFPDNVYQPRYILWYREDLT